MAIDKLYSKEMVEWYDQMYCADQETTKQANFLKKIFKKHNVKSVLDVACGTGRHSVELKKQGFNITAIDLEKPMIDYAKEKVKENDSELEFKVRDMKNINLNKKFDAAIVLYTSFAYLETNEEVEKALKSIKNHLKKGGILIIETVYLWPKIAANGIMQRMVNEEKKGEKYYKLIEKNSLDPTNNYLYSRQTHIRKEGSKKLKTIEDKKPTKLRLFFPNELDLFFEKTGLKTIDFYGDFEGHKLSKDNHKRLIALAKKK